MVKAVLDEGGRDPAATRHFHHRHPRRRDAHQPRLRPCLHEKTPTRCGPSCPTAWDPDGTVGARRTPSRSSARRPTCTPQGYFVYDSKKAGSVTVSAHLARPPADPLDLPHQPGRVRGLPPVQFRVDRIDVLHARPMKAQRSCSTARTVPTRSGTACPVRCRRPFIRKKLRFFVINAFQVALKTVWAGACATPSCRPVSSP